MSRAFSTVMSIVALTPFPMCVACRSVPKHDAETHAILASVTYDTTTSSPEPRSDDPAPQANAEPQPTIRKPEIATRAYALRDTIGNGVKSTFSGLVNGLFQGIASIFESDEEDEFAPRATADRELNQWVSDRNKWLSKK